MTKSNKPQSVQQARPPEPAAAPDGAAPAEGPGWGWTIALIVWAVGFGGLCLYELWTGVLMGLLRN